MENVGGYETPHKRIEELNETSKDLAICEGAKVNALTSLNEGHVIGSCKNRMKNMGT